MKTSRHHARASALQALYQLDTQRVQKTDDIRTPTLCILEETELTNEVRDYCLELVDGVWLKCEQYDRMITDVSDHWDVSRMAVVDRNILRLGIYELIERPDVPARVVIDEAVELGREYGDAETPHFINGVLDAIWKKHPTCRIARGEPK